LQAGGRRFDPDRLHTGGQPSGVRGRGFGLETDGRRLANLFQVSRMFEFGLIMWLRQSVPGRLITPSKRPCEGVVLFFGNVNQVLVRLWARVSGFVGLSDVCGLLTDHGRLATGH
jgi:hypothetical protein